MENFKYKIFKYLKKSELSLKLDYLTCLELRF